MINSVSGIVAYIKDIQATADFYGALGFTIHDQTEDALNVSVGDFWIDFHPQDKEDKPEFQKEANPENKGAGQFLYLNMDDVDATHKELLEKGLKPSSEPKNYEWGNRELL